MNQKENENKKLNIFLLIILIIISYIKCSENIGTNSPEESLIDNVECDIENYFLNNCNISFTNDNEKIIFKKNVIEMISNGSLSNLLNNIFNNNKAYIREEKEEKYILTSIFPPDINDNLILINFENFFACLLNNYIDLIRLGVFSFKFGIFQIENKLERYKIPIIEYKIFSEDQIIDSTECNNISVNHYLFIDDYNIDINEYNIYLYNESSEYYKDECENYISENGTDMSLYTRRNNFNEKYYLCESNCLFKGFENNNNTNNNNLKSVCECKIKTKLLSEEDLYIGNLVYQMKNEEKITNFEVMKCSYLITSADDIKKNPGFYLPLFGLILLFFIMILFCFKGYNNLSKRIDEAIKLKFHENHNKNKNNKLIVFTVKNNNNNNKKQSKRKSVVKLQQNKKGNKRSSLKNVSVNSKNDLINKKRKTLAINNINLNTNINNNDDEAIFVFENDYEINMISFETALKCDKRTFGDYYCSLIKNKQLILYSFCDYNSYNSSIVKKIIFFLSFIYHYGINAFFFIDSILHQIYLDEGKYNIPIQFPNAVYSAIVSTGLIRLLILLIDTEQNILEKKKKKNENISNLKKKDFMKKLIIKFLCFFIINTLLLIFFWYYLTCFNAVYLNTQITLCINTLFSFALSNIFPFIYYIIPAFFRRDIIKNKSLKKLKADKTELNDAEYIYKLSQNLQNFL